MPTLLLFLLFLAQIGGGAIVGRITDPSGAAIPGAAVRALNVGTNETHNALSNDSGYYEFPLLPAGRYRLEVTAAGFQKTTGAEFELNSGTRPRLDLQLGLAQRTESVEAVAPLPLLSGTAVDLGVVIDRDKVEGLPLNGRNFQQLVGLQPGVVVSPGSSAGARGGIEFHGSGALTNNLLLDGADMSFGEVNATASDVAAGSGGGALINVVSLEAIQEFKAAGNAFNAEYGHSAGGVVNVITRSGTNDFHGTLFNFFRNDALDANSFFSNRSRLAKPALRWNQYGANFGGPIRRNRAFFFFNYEGAQVRRSIQITGNTATPALLAQLPAAIRQDLQNQLPQSYTPTANPLIGTHNRNDRRSDDENTYLSRIDFQTSRHTVSARYSYNHQDYVVPNFQPSLARYFPNRFHNVMVQDGWTLSPSLFNEARVGFNHVGLFRYERGREAFPAWIQVLNVGLNATLPSYIDFENTTVTGTDNLTWIHGTHTIKTGIEIRNLDSERTQGGQPTHIYSTLADLEADHASQIQILFGGPKGLRSREYGFYAQDEWRVSPRFQLNACIRYEYYTPLRGGFNISSSDPFGPFIPKDAPMFAPDHNNWAPRAGLVWDPTGRKTWIVRAGAGIGYLPLQPIYLYDMAFIDPALPFTAVYTPADVPPQYQSFPLSQSFVNTVAANPALLPKGLILSRNVADHHIRDTYSEQWNLTVQRSLGKDLAVQASYVGSHTLKLTAPRDVNLVDPARGVRPHPELGDVFVLEGASRTGYNALEISANQRLRKGMTFDAYYTWAKSLAYDAADASITFSEVTVQDVYNIAASRGPKQGEVRNRFVGVYSVELPGSRSFIHGWKLEGIAGASSGQPVDVTSGIDLVGNGRVSGQRPDSNPGVSPYLHSTDRVVWLNPAAFDNATPAAQRRYGNLGYNTVRGPGAFTFDAGLQKTFASREHGSLTFRAESFNLLNHVVLGSPVATVSNPNFGRILSGSDGRNIQIALKYLF